LSVAERFRCQRDRAALQVAPERGPRAVRNGVNPIDYLLDALLRISTHPADRIDELLPDRWKPADPV
jgi:hypothetical protein